MNREILFRGKRLDDGEWVYGYYVYQYNGNQIYLLDGRDEYGFDARFVFPETVGQYAGLTDKNGRRIYEGDIVKRYSKYEPHILAEVGIVINDLQKACWSLEALWIDGEIEGKYTKDPSCIEALSSYDDEKVNSDLLEVIGNIHDNSIYVED